MVNFEKSNTIIIFFKIYINLKYKQITIKHTSPQNLKNKQTKKNHINYGRSATDIIQI